MSDEELNDEIKRMEADSPIDRSQFDHLSYEEILALYFEAIKQ